MKDLVIYCIRNEKIIRISEGDGCNLSQEDIDNGYVDYLYYDIFDPQNLQDVEDGGMILLKKPVKEEFNSIQGVVNRVCEMIGYDYQLVEGVFPDEHIVLSGLNEWYNYLKNSEPEHICSTCKHGDKKITEEPCLNCDIRMRNDKWEGKDVYS